MYKASIKLTASFEYYKVCNVFQVIISKKELFRSIYTSQQKRTFSINSYEPARLFKDQNSYYILMAKMLRSRHTNLLPWLQGKCGSANSLKMNSFVCVFTRFTLSNFFQRGKYVHALFSVPNMHRIMGLHMS